jgi:integrase
VLRLPDSKTGAKTIHLNAPALAVVERLPRMEGCPYVLPGRGKNGEPTALTNLYHWWYAVRDYADLKDVRIHDLRHSFASIAVAGGLALPVIGGLLGHTQAATTQRYAHLADDPLKVAAQMVGARLADAMRGGAQPDNVVTLPTGKRRPRKGAR